jgi:hypothetical protein
VAGLQSEDQYVVWLIVIIFAVWGVWKLKHWLSMPKNRAMLPLHGKFEIDQTVEWLEQAGYTVLSGKKRIPVAITVDDEQELQSRYYIDYFVRSNRDRKLYAVKLARERKPIPLTGSAVREYLLPYYLLFPELDGVLYVDTSQRAIRRIQFEIGEE